MVGGIGASQMPTYVPMMLNKMLGAKFKVVEGYGSTNAIILAIERGEVDGICMSSSTLLGPRVDLIEKGVLKILFNVEAKPMPTPAGVPTIFTRFNDEQRQIVSLINSAIEFGRPFAAPPGVPADRLAALQAALRATVADAEFIAEAAKLKFIVTYTSPQEMADDHRAHVRDAEGDHRERVGADAGGLSAHVNGTGRICSWNALRCSRPRNQRSRLSSPIPLRSGTSLRKR